MDRRTVVAGAGATVAAGVLGGAGWALAGSTTADTDDTTLGVTGASLGVQDSEPGIQIAFGDAPPESVVVDQPDGQRFDSVGDTSAGGSAWVPLSWPIRRTGEWTLRVRRGDERETRQVPVSFGWSVDTDWTGEGVNATITHNGTAPVNVGELRLTSLAQGLRREQTVVPIGERGHALTRGETLEETLLWEDAPDRLQLQIFRDDEIASGVDQSLWEIRLDI